jgi:diguanylate cyclase (GGDEF)-like protein
VEEIGTLPRRLRDEDRLHGEGVASYVALPLPVRDRVVGALTLGSGNRADFGVEQLPLLQQVAERLAMAVENARLFREAQERVRQMAALYEVGKVLIQTLELDELLHKVLDIVHHTFRFENCAVLLPSEDGHELRVRAQRGYSEEAVKEFKAHVGEEAITATVAKTGKLLYVPDVRKDPRYVRGVEHGRSELALPLTMGDEILGVLDIESPKVDAFSSRDINALSLFATQVAVALDKARLFTRVQEQARTDGLTGLLNQKTFHDRLHVEVERTRDSLRPFSLALIDLDNLKEVNDSCGHPAGNTVLVQVAEVLREHVGEGGALARYGGDEFALILPDCGLEDGVQAAQRVCEAISRIQVEGFGQVTASCGVAAFPTTTVDETALVGMADGAMYQAKKDGKNCVRAARGPRESITS